MNPKASIIVFPGSNCDRDAEYGLKLSGFDVEFYWYEETKPFNSHLIFIPGGFSYGDYLRAGALAAVSDIMERIKNFIEEERGLVIGICNGFQILTEAGILPGALMRNKNLKFICKDIEVKVESFDTPFTKYLTKDKLVLPIAHGEGNYYIPEERIKELDDKIIFRYLENLNGSILDIAGIVNEKMNVLGMMPHPERNCSIITGNQDGALIFYSIRKWFDKDY